MRITSIPDTSNLTVRSKASLCQRLCAQIMSAARPGALADSARRRRRVGSSIPPECHCAFHPRFSKRSVKTCRIRRSTMGLGVQSAKRSISWVARTAPRQKRQAPRSTQIELERRAFETHLETGFAVPRGRTRIAACPLHLPTSGLTQEQTKVRELESEPEPLCRI
jgi:hypothetical protein